MLSKAWPANLKFLGAMQAFIEKAGIDTGFNASKISQINMAVEEVVVNIINHAFKSQSVELPEVPPGDSSRHGTKGDRNLCRDTHKATHQDDHTYQDNYDHLDDDFHQNKEKLITFEVDSDLDALTIRIIDSGKHFDPLQEEDPDTTLNIKDRPIGGLGIFMVKRFTDKLHYIRQNNKNILTMIILKQKE